MNIETKTGGLQETSTMCAAVTTDFARCLTSRSIVFTNNQPNNAAISLSKNASRKKRQKKKKAQVNNSPAPLTVTSTMLSMVPSTIPSTLSSAMFSIVPSTMPSTLFSTMPSTMMLSMVPSTIPSTLSSTMPSTESQLATVSTSIGVKRPHNSIDNSVPNSGITKRLKIFDEKNQMVNDIGYRLARAIVSTNMSLGITQLTLFRGAISKEIDKIVSGPFSPVPKFHDSYIRLGAIVVRCVDEASLHWLSKQIGTISPWPEAKLKMITLNELQRYFRACVWIPGPLETTKIVLKRLERQNPGLNTASWQIFAENLGASEEGRSLFIGVPELDFKKLQAIDFKAYLGLGQVNFVFSNINQEDLNGG